MRAVRESTANRKFSKDECDWPNCELALALEADPGWVVRGLELVANHRDASAPFRSPASRSRRHCGAESVGCPSTVSRRRGKDPVMRRADDDVSVLQTQSPDTAYLQARAGYRFDVASNTTVCSHRCSASTHPTSTPITGCDQTRRKRERHDGRDVSPMYVL